MVRPLLTWALRRTPLRRLRPDPFYRAFRRELRRFDGLSTEEIRREQLRRLQRLVRMAYEETDFYRETYRAARVHPKDLRELSDLAILPVIDKEVVREHGTRLLRRGADPRRLESISTSGTTGSPLTLFIDEAAAARERAAIHHLWSKVGYQPSAGRVELRGIFEGSERVLHLPNELVLRVNINRLEAPDLDPLIEAINACPYRFLHGYPHALERFARLLELEGRQQALRQPHAILLGSEQVLDTQLAQIKRAFPGVPVLAHYGLAERVALGAWVDERRDYHFLPAYSLVEVDDMNRLVGTSLINEVMPLIRYRTTDVMGGYQAEPTCLAHRFPVAERIEGRHHDMLRSCRGDFISPVMANHALLGATGFHACQLIQHALTSMEVVVEPGPCLTQVKTDFQQVAMRLRDIFGCELSVQLTITERIPRLPCGKFKWVESRLESQSGASLLAQSSSA
jgi:phenylacetate-CoA ligase